MIEAVGWQSCWELLTTAGAVRNDCYEEDIWKLNVRGSGTYSKSLEKGLDHYGKLGHPLALIWLDTGLPVGLPENPPFVYEHVMP